MAARRSQKITTEIWNGHWGADARYYARRSDGACFAIDGAVNVFDLAGTTPPSRHARAVDSLPLTGRYTLSVFAVRPREGSGARPVSARLLAYGVRRRI